MNKKLEGALEALEVLDKTITPLLEPVLARYEDDLSNIITANYFVLKQALLKAQENEKEIAKYKQLEKDLGCPLDVFVKPHNVANVELCDEFVVIGYYKNKPVHFDTLLEAQKFVYENGCQDKDYVEIKGAIWTDKGLIYVAKMNEKGELELL